MDATVGNEEAEEMSEYELLRQRNIKERDIFFTAIENSAEFKEIMESIEETRDASESKSETKGIKRKRNSNHDAPFRFTGQIPQTRRQSLRLLGVKPNLKYDDAEVEVTEDEKPKIRIRTRKSTSKRACPVPVLAVEDVTPAMLNNIMKSGHNKIYSPNGTSCHQCRQKTLDTKTVCRSGKCVGVRGQVCGPCLVNRYGEKVADALLDRNWQCPVCRDICNCSFCLPLKGKQPTGILAPLAARKGYKSVKEMLEAEDAANNINKPSTSNMASETEKTIPNLLKCENEVNMDIVTGAEKPNSNLEICEEPNEEVKMDTVPETEKPNPNLKKYEEPEVFHNEVEKSPK